MEDQRKTDWTKLIGVVVLVLLTVECAFLIFQNRQLKSVIAAMSAGSGERREALKTGDIVDPFAITTLDGKSAELNYPDSTRKYLLFVFSTTCPHCEKNYSRWSAISDSIRGTGCDVIGVSVHSVDQTQTYVKSKAGGFQTVCVTDTSFGRRYKIVGVPETILIRGNRTVEKSWIGELTADNIKEIEALTGAAKVLTH